MVNRIFILICLFVASLVCDAQTTIDLNVGYINPSGTISQKPKAPVNPPYVEQDGYTLTFGFHSDYTLCLIDDNENVIYTTYVPASVSSVALPSSLSGTYEIPCCGGCSVDLQSTEE